MNNVEEIYRQIKLGNYKDAFKSVQNLLIKNFNLELENELRFYKELIKLRVTIKTLLGEDDPIINEYLRKETFPESTIYEINNHKVVITLGNNFNSKADAYVNTVDFIYPFVKMGSKSATKYFIVYVGENEIQKQLEECKKFIKGDFLIIKHANLLAPFSYHIGFYSDEAYDLTMLKTGIKKVLEDAVNKKIKVIAFFPLGFDYVNRAKESEKNKVANELALCIAEAINEFIWNNTGKYLPEIHFNIGYNKTLRTFDNAFYHCSLLPKEYYDQKSKLTKLEKDILEKVNTKSEEYVEKIKSIAYSILSDSSLLILGETGVGKTHFAKVVHDLSNRKNKNFISVNCSYLRQENLVTELFGWVRGSFTDAKQDGTGAIEAAEGGTLFLDEIGYADIDVQKSLLKFLDDGKYNKFGAKKNELEADVRLIFGTSGDLKNLIKKGLVLPEFYERINQVEFTIPPLRKRKEDIDSFVLSFLSNINKISETAIVFSREAIETLKEYKWPGNIRQLKNFVENLINKAKYKNITMIEDEMILSNPPRDVLYNSSNRILDFEIAAKELLQAWDVEKGEIIEKVIGPILVKIFTEDLKMKRSDSKRFLGFDSSHIAESRFDRYLNNYKSLDELL